MLKMAEWRLEHHVRADGMPRALGSVSAARRSAQTVSQRMAAMNLLAAELSATARARAVPLRVAADAVARRRWRLLLQLRDTVNDRSGGAAAGPRHHHSVAASHKPHWPPPPRQYGDVRLLLESALLRRLRYRAPPTVFAATLAHHFDLTQGARCSSLLTQLFAAFAQDEVVANAAVGETAVTQADGTNSSSSSTLAAAGLLPDPLPPRCRPRGTLGATATPSTSSTSLVQEEELVEQESVVDMRSVVAALMVVFPHYGFVTAGAHEQLLCLFEGYCRPGALKGISAAHGGGRRSSVDFGGGLLGLMQHAHARQKQDATKAAHDLVAQTVEDSSLFEDLGGEMPRELAAGLEHQKIAEAAGTALQRRTKARVARERAYTERQGGAAAARGETPLAEELVLPLCDVRALLTVAAVGDEERAHTLGRFEHALQQHALAIGHPAGAYRVVSMVAFDAVLRLSTEYDAEHDGMDGCDEDDWTEEGGAVARSFAAQTTARLLPTGAGAAGYGDFGEGVGLDLGAQQVLSERRLVQLQERGDELRDEAKARAQREGRDAVVARGARGFDGFGTDLLGALLDRRDDDDDGEQEPADAGDSRMAVLAAERAAGDVWMQDDENYAAGVRHLRAKQLAGAIEDKAARRQSLLERRRRSSAAFNAAEQFVSWKQKTPAQVREILHKAAPGPALARPAVALISAGAAHTLCTLQTSGILLSWGRGADGRLGHGDEMKRPQPRVVAQTQRLHMVAIAAGGAHSIAVSEAREAYTWGCSERGQCGHDGTEYADAGGGGGVPKRNQLIPRKIECDALMAPPDEFGRRQCLAIEAVAAGGEHTALIAHGGHLYVCGDGRHGQLGIKLDAGGDHGRGGKAARATARLAADMSDVNKQYEAAYELVYVRKPEQLESAETVLSMMLAAHPKHARARALLATVGQKKIQAVEFARQEALLAACARTPRLVNAFRHDTVSRVACGMCHTLCLSQHDPSKAWGAARKRIGVSVRQKVYSWGRGDSGQLGHGSFEQIVGAPREVAALAAYRIESLSAGRTHSMAVTTDGVLLTFGSGVAGRLGHGGTMYDGAMMSADCPAPKIVEALRGQRVVGAFAGEDHSLALVELTQERNEWAYGHHKRELLSWGTARNGRLGLGARNRDGSAGMDARVPERVQLAKDIDGEECTVPPQAAVAGGHHTVVLSAAGEIFTCGAGREGRLGHSADATDKLQLTLVDEFEAPGRHIPNFEHDMRQLHSIGKKHHR